ncbi:hypothetical protein Hdeb2414_s0018g00523871 [Helianthus debilis subsp. tardiflorus]
MEKRGPVLFWFEVFYYYYLLWCGVVWLGMVNGPNCLENVCGFWVLGIGKGVLVVMLYANIDPRYHM